MKLFISYARTNRKQVEELQDVLERSGHDAWFDDEITAGDDWWNMILTSIESCDIFVFALTPESTNSEACHAEFQYAVTLNKPILPIMLKQAELPIGKLAETHYVAAKNLRNTDTVLEISRALFRLQERITHKEFPAPEPTPERPPFPFPDDPLTEVREQIGNLSSLSENDLLGMIYHIKQVSRSSKKTSVESRSLLEKMVSNPSLPYGIVHEARIALKEIPEIGKSNMMPYLMGIAGIIIIAVIGFFALQNMGGGGEATDEPTEEVTEIVSNELTKTPTAIDEPIPSDTPTDEPTATDTPIPSNTPTDEPIATDTSIPPTSIPSRVISVENTAQLQAMSRLVGHTDIIWDVEFSADGTKLATASRDTTIRVWNVETGELLSILRGHSDSVVDVSFSPDSSQLISGSADKTVRLWNIETEEELGVYEGHTFDVYAVSFHPSGNQFASGGTDNRVILWNGSSSVTERILDKHTNAVWSVEYTSDGTQLFSGGFDNFIRIWQPMTGIETHNIRTGHNILDLSVSSDARLVATANDSYTIELFNAATGEQLTTFEGHTRIVYGIDFNPDDSLLASASGDDTIKIWDTTTYELIMTLSGHEENVQDVQFSPDGNLIASASEDNTVIIWGLPQD